MSKHLVWHEVIVSDQGYIIKVRTEPRTRLDGITSIALPSRKLAELHGPEAVRQVRLRLEQQKGW